jgi:hypothetical protein
MFKNLFRIEQKLECLKATTKVNILLLYKVITKATIANALPAIVSADFNQPVCQSVIMFRSPAYTGKEAFIRKAVNENKKYQGKNSTGREKNHLHISPVLPAHFIKCMRDLPERTIFYRFHQLFKKVTVLHGNTF